MLPDAFAIVAHKLSIWLAARLAVPRRFPLPLSDLYGRIEALVHSREAMAMIFALGLVSRSTASAALGGTSTAAGTGADRFSHRAVVELVYANAPAGLIVKRPTD